MWGKIACFFGLHDWSPWRFVKRQGIFKIPPRRHCYRCHTYQQETDYVTY